MPFYRYANSNGQFLPSKFIQAAEPATDQAFRVDQCYDLKRSFFSGSVGANNSFVTSVKMTGYTAVQGSLLAWWRFDQISASGSVGDSSGNGYIASQSNNRNTPSIANVTPSTFIQKKSLYFDNVGSFDADKLEVKNPDAFTFGDGTTDSPFSVSAWIRVTADTSTTQEIFTKYCNTSGRVAYEWKLDFDSSFALYFRCYDNSLSNPSVVGFIGKKTANNAIAVGGWHHVVATYNGAGVIGTTGIEIYVDGVNTNATTQGSDLGYGSMQPTTASVIIGSHDHSSDSYAFEGYIAEVAVWNRRLHQDDVAALYGTSKAGAFRLVRDFSQKAIDNDTRLLGSSTRSRGFDVSGYPSDMMEGVRQGVSVQTIDQLINYNSFKLRPNTDFIKTVDGRDVPSRAFDETMTVHVPTTVAAGSGSTWTKADGWSSTRVFVAMGSVGKLSARVSHEREHRDLGQIALYDDNSPFEDTADMTPLAIIKKHPEALVLPLEMVSQTSDEVTDGVIEPLTIRAVIDRSSIESPFHAHGVRASLGGHIDAFRRSCVIEDGVNLDDPRATAPFLDDVESIGGGYQSDGLLSGSIDLPGAFSDSFAKITPHIDYANDRDKEYTTNGVTSTVATFLKITGSMDNLRTHDTMASRGFVFINNPIGIESIAYGGLKK